jgi:hypothetical protein
MKQVEMLPLLLAGVIYGGKPYLCTVNNKFENKKIRIAWLYNVAS